MMTITLTRMFAELFTIKVLGVGFEHENPPTVPLFGGQVWKMARETSNQVQWMPGVLVGGDPSTVLDQISGSNPWPAKVSGSLDSNP